MTRATRRQSPEAAIALDTAVAEDLGALFQVVRRVRCRPFSCVYLAREMAGARVIALKVLSCAETEGRSSEGFEAALVACATLDHAHIIPVYEYGRTSRLLWYSMPSVDGRSLDDVLRDTGPLELRACVRLVEQVARALHYAHGRGVTHGNLKPANVMVGSDGLALLGDFAVARALEAGAPHASGAARSRLTRYVAPEERSAGDCGPAADQYGLGVLALECLEPGASLDARRVVPPVVREALTRATSPDPLARFPNVLDLVAALEGEPHARQPPARQHPVRRSPAPPQSARRATPRVLVDEAYEQDAPPSRTVRRLTIGASVVIVLAGAAASVLWLAGRGDAPAQTESGPSAPIRAESPALPVPLDTIGLAKPLAAAPTRRPAKPPPRLAPSPPPAPPKRAVSLAPGRLFVGATPWGDLYVDDRLVGHTPITGVAVAAGSHRVRVVRDGFQPFEQVIDVTPGQDVRLTDLVLRPLPP